MRVENHRMKIYLPRIKLSVTKKKSIYYHIFFILFNGLGSRGHFSDKYITITVSYKDRLYFTFCTDITKKKEERKIYEKAY